MVFQACGKTIGTVVDALSEVLRAKRDHIAPPPTVAGSGHDYLNGLAKLDTWLLILLEFDSIFAAEDIETLQDAAVDG
jgi:chemotaxis signal transduction protein